MKVKFNDGVLAKNEISSTLSEISFVITNEVNDFYMVFDNDKMVFPSFEYHDNIPIEQSLKELSKKCFNDDVIFSSLISIEDWQYRYYLPKGAYTNRLVNNNSYHVNNPSSINIENGRFINLFEIQNYLINHQNDQHYYYDNRILLTILKEFFKDNYLHFYDPDNYINYLKKFYYGFETEEFKKLKEYYIRTFINKQSIGDICNDSKELITNIFDYLQIKNDQYAILPLKNYFFMHNGDRNYPADIIGIYKDSPREEKLISLYILKNILGFDFEITLCNEYQKFTNDQGKIIGNYVGLPEFVIYGDQGKLLDVAIREQKILKKLK